MGAPAIHDGCRALANQTSSDRVVIRLIAVTNDDVDEVPVMRPSAPQPMRGRPSADACHGVERTEQGADDTAPASR
jgi:hypothetical protein